jgi:hypothetical protein
VIANPVCLAPSTGNGPKQGVWTYKANNMVTDIDDNSKPKGCYYKKTDHNLTKDKIMFNTHNDGDDATNTDHIVCKQYSVGFNEIVTGKTKTV